MKRFEVRRSQARDPAPRRAALPRSSCSPGGGINPEEFSAVAESSEPLVGTLRRGVVSGSLKSLVGWILSIFISLPLTIALVRVMPQVQYGELAMATSVAGLMDPLAAFGLSQSVALYGGEAFGAVGGPGLGAVVRTANGLILRATLGLVPIVGAVVAVMSAAPELRGAGLAFLVLSPTLLLAPLSESALGLVQATFRASQSLVASVLSSTLLLGLTLAALAVGGTSAVVVAGARSVSTLSGAIVLIVGSGWIGLSRRGARQPPPTISAFARTGLTFTVSAMLGMAISQLDVVILGAVSGPAQVSLYAPVSKLADTALAAFALVSGYMLPAMSASQASSVLDSGLKDMYHWGSRWAFACVCPAVALMLVVPGPVLHLLFGSHRLALVLPARLLGVGVLVSITLGFNGLALVTSASRAVIVRNVVIALLVDVAACILFIPRFGAEGAAGATMAALVVGNTLSSVALARRSKVFPFDWGMCCTFGLFAIGLAVSFALIHYIHPVSNLVQVAITAVVSVSAALASFCAVRLRRREAA